MTIRLDSHLPQFHRGAPPQLPVRCATTANITIATALNNGDTLDGLTLATGDRVLVKDQTAGSGNGVYIVGVTPARSFDMAEGVAAWGAIIYVIAGTANGGTLWRNTNATLPTIDTTALTWASISLASIAASAVTLADAGGFWTSTDVESWSQEIGKLVVGYQAHGNTGSTETFDAPTAGWHSATLNAATVTFTFTGATSGLVAAMVLELAQDGTGGRLVTWPSSVVWPGGVAPTLSTAAAAVDILTFFSRDGGTTWYGFLAGATSAVAAAATAAAHAHVVSEAHLSNGSVTLYTLDQAFETGSVIAWNTTTLARLGVTEAQPDQATVSAAGSSGDTIMFDYAATVV